MQAFDEKSCAGISLEFSYFLPVVQGQSIGTTTNGEITIDATITQGTSGSIVPKIKSRWRKVARTIKTN